MGIIEKIKKICFKILWSGKNDISGLPRTSWKTLACPKFLGGWGLKIPAYFQNLLLPRVLGILYMDMVFGFRFLFRSIFILYLCLSRSEVLLNIKGEFQFVGKRFYGLLI